MDRVIRVARVVWVVREGRSKGYKWSRLSRWLALMIYILIFTSTL